MRGTINCHSECIKRARSWRTEVGSLDLPGVDSNLKTVSVYRKRSTTEGDRDPPGPSRAWEMAQTDRSTRFRVDAGTSDKMYESGCRRVAGRVGG